MRFVWWSARNWKLQRRFYWHLVGANGEILCQNTQGYSQARGISSSIGRTPRFGRASGA